MTEKAHVPAGAAAQPRTTSPRKRWAFRGIALLLLGVVLEFVWYFAIVAFMGPNATSALSSEQSAIAYGTPRKGEANETIHPYTGWAFNPEVSEGLKINGREVPVNRMGLVDDGPTITKRSAEKLIVAVAGGSVAWFFSVDGEERLRERLTTDPRTAGREFDIVRLALPGTKQPQQLMTLAWALSLGAEFDVVVNIDGYNEAVLAIHDNYLRNVNIGYPRAWDARTSDIVDPRKIGTSYRLFELRGTRQNLASAALSSPFRWLQSYQLYWYLRNRMVTSRIHDLAGETFRKNAVVGGQGFQATGPLETFSTETEAEDAAVEIWRRCSLQMHHLAQGATAVYIHALQPNQYLPGSKPLSEKEREDFYSDKVPEGKTLARLYPKMIQAGNNLRAEGVNFHDLTGIYSEHPQTLYIDWCCHVNQEGNEILADHIADAILAALAE